MTIEELDNIYHALCRIPISDYTASCASQELTVILQATIECNYYAANFCFLSNEANSNIVWNVNQWEIYPFRHNSVMYSSTYDIGEYQWVHQVLGHD